MQMSHSLTKMQTLVISRSELARAQNHIRVVTAHDVSKTWLHIKHRCFRYNLASEKKFIEFRHKPATVNRFACL